MKKIFTPTNIFGISLIITVNFYFSLRINSILVGDQNSYIGLIKYTLHDILIPVAVLLFFSICLMCLIAIITGKINKKISFLILILLTTFLVGISFKTFFNVADYSMNSLGNKLLNINDVNTSFIARLAWFLMPFIISFIFLFFLRKDFFKVYEFLNIVGLVLFILMSYQIFQLNIIFSSFDYDNKYFKNHNNLKKQRQVIWIIFDEFDPEIAFSNKYNIHSLPNFTELIKNSFTHHKMFSAAQGTLESIPAMLIGKSTNGNRYRNHKLYLLSSDNTEIPFTIENTIFNRLKSDGFSSSILGFHHPYCFIFKIKCKTISHPIKWYDGIFHMFHMNHVYKIFNKGARRDLTPQLVNSMYKFIESPTDLIFIHLNIPHLCSNCRNGYAGYAEKLYKYKFEVKNKSSAYLLNLKLSDFVLGNILIKLDIKNSKKDNLLILTSDHWFRDREINPNSEHPSLFIAKIYSDNQKITLSEPDSTIYIQELVHKFLRKEISKHSDIKLFFEQRPIHRKTFF